VLRLTSHHDYLDRNDNPRRTGQAIAMSTEVHEGGCFCGAVRYRTTGALRRVSACACRRCQKRTGSALGISVYVDKRDVAFARSKPDWLTIPHGIEVWDTMPR
jgi:hypothetical protein